MVGPLYRELLGKLFGSLLQGSEFWVRSSCGSIAGRFAARCGEFEFCKILMNQSEECSMRMWAQSHVCRKRQWTNSVLGAALTLIFLIMGASQSASALPAFARKYGLRCSACHESWPMLNYFGQKFKDNGYQLMNDRDAPIWQNPGYWPVTFRILPIWHRVSQGKQAVKPNSASLHPASTSAASIFTPAALWKRIFRFMFCRPPMLRPRFTLKRSWPDSTTFLTAHG
jgi:hypothetical protein